MDEKERVLTIEDSGEMIVKNKNKTQILVNKVNKNNPNDFTYIDGINVAMRLYPQRLFLGEIDVNNTAAFLRINNTGHKGNGTTIHSNSVEDCINAIKSNLMLSGFNVANDRALNSFIVSALDYIIQVRKDPFTNERKIVDILHVKDFLKGQF